MYIVDIVFTQEPSIQLKVRDICATENMENLQRAWPGIVCFIHIWFHFA